MRLGFAVKVLGEGGLPSHDTRRWQSGPHLSVSIERMHAIFEYLDRHDIRMYRMASAFVPYGTHPEMPQFHRQVDECAGELEQVGARARELGIRLSFHPGQYTVLNSMRPEVVDAALRDLELHARVLDVMEQPDEAVVVLHVGARGDDPAAARERFLAGFERLSVRARARLVVENDDRLFGLGDVLWISERTGLRIVWDAHHHLCHDPDGIPEREAFELALKTWPGDVVPKVHYSSPRSESTMRAHADLIDAQAFERFLREVVCDTHVDVMLESKAKDLALLQLRDELAAIRPADRPASSARTAPPVAHASGLQAPPSRARTGAAKRRRA